MDKALFRAYVKELVKETVADEVKKLLPKLLGEAVSEIKSLQEVKSVTAQPSNKFSRTELAQMMGLQRHDDTIVASTERMVTHLPPNVTENNPAVQAINKDYSQLMKKMGLSK